MKKKILLALILLLLPLGLGLFVCPSTNHIVKQGYVKCSPIKDEKGKSIDAYIVWGDIFNPRISSINGWDLVGISMYFDPFTFKDTLRLVDTPVFHNALVNSTSSRSEFEYVALNLVKAAIDNSEELVGLIGKSRIKTNEGDQINPYIWPSFPNSKLHRENNIRFLAALPLFDTSPLIGKSKDELEKLHQDLSNTANIRKALKKNVEYIVNTLIGEASNEQKVHSIALPIIGSTSHKGGDSALFLNFSTGIKSIYDGIKRSDIGYSLNKIYLVGFHRHQGVYKDEIISSLKYFWLLSIVDYIGSKYSWAIVSYYFISFFILLLLFYKSYAQNFQNKKVSRINLFGVGIGISGFFSAVTSGILLLAIPNISFANFGIYYLQAILAIVVLLFAFLYLTKHFIKL